MLARAGAWLDRAAFHPASLPDGLVTGIALTPPVLAGLIIYRVTALEMLAVALVVGMAAQITVAMATRGDRVDWPASPLMAAVVGVALIGPGSLLVRSVEVAVIAAVLELIRGRFAPGIRAQTGLLAYAAVSLVLRGTAHYVDPSSGVAQSDPISVWFKFFSPSAVPVDPIHLYVGTVPGPVFATSLLAVVVGAAWLAYARRMSFALLVAFLLGAAVPIYLYHWDFVFQLDSAPLWFAGALILADKLLLPDSRASRPVIGFAAGALALGFRHWGVGAEGAFFVAAGIQALIALIGLLAWGASAGFDRARRARRLRAREANLRVVKGYGPPAEEPLRRRAGLRG